MSISVDHESGHDVSYSVRACGRCGAQMERDGTARSGRSWHCTACGRWER